uniref:Chondroitin sulfate proteoglycan 5 n=1 Tax=Cyclopterus lumpus TaxID=8103 RepID=A0A8C2X794_CYCLU
MRAPGSIFNVYFVNKRDFSPNKCSFLKKKIKMHPGKCSGRVNRGPIGSVSVRLVFYDKQSPVANVTSLLSEEEGPVKVAEAVAVVTATAAPPPARRIPRASEEDEQSSGMFGEPVVPAPEEVGVASPPQLSPDSAEMEHLLPGNPHGGDAAEVEEEDEEEDLFTTTTAQPTAPTNPANPDVLHVDFFDPSSRGRGLDLAPASPSSLAHELQGGDPTSWAMPDSYDYLTPYEDGVSPTADEYTYSTTTDAYESDDDLRLSAGSRPKPRAPAPGASLPGAGPPVVNGSCRSPCDTLPNFCFNGGQCYLMEGMGVFCRCNVQDYIWHKGARCESVVTEFQVMVLAVGASALVLLLLFMIVVCFAKKLHVLKTENKKLRKRSSKYRPSSEQHNDNFSLSTIAEGSHPNKTMSRYTWECKTKEESDCEDDPNAQNKLEDPVKAQPKEDDSLNIHNSLTPKHENHKVLGEDNSSEVNSLQNNMM